MQLDYDYNNAIVPLSALTERTKNLKITVIKYYQKNASKTAEG